MILIVVNHLNSKSFKKHSINQSFICFW